VTLELHAPRLFWIAAITPLILFGASQARASDSEFNSIHAGATSVQLLTFGGGYRGSLRTSGIYLKSHISDRGAIRAGVDLSLDESSGKNPLGPGAENNRRYYVIVGAELDEYVDASGSVTVFLGVGPYWTRSREFYDRLDVFSPDPSTTYTYYNSFESRGWEAGGSAVVGVEWFFKRRLSLLGRVGATLGFGKRHERQVADSTDPNYVGTVSEFNSSTVQAGTSTAALGLGIYF